MRQQKMPNMVGGKGQFDSVRAQLKVIESSSRVVDEHIEVRMCSSELGGDRTDLVLVR